MARNQPSTTAGVGPTLPEGSGVRRNIARVDVLKEVGDMRIRFMGTWSRLGITGAAALIGVLMGAQVAGAHVTVVPNQSLINAYELYTVRVPSEKPIPTVKVRLDFPTGMLVSRFASTPGWTRTVERDASGQVTAVTWAGGSIASDEIGIFAFQARNGGEPGRVLVRASQTYSDGSVVEWANPSEPNPAPVVTLAAPLTAQTDVTHASMVGQVIAAVAYLDGVGFHGVDTAIAGGDIPVGTLGKVQNAAIVAAAIKWPPALHDDGHALAERLRDLAAAVQAADASAAAEPAKSVHDIEHRLSRKAYAWLREMGGDATSSDSARGH
ncbi:MAG: YcnI family protein [Chloroflexi bacterium]|nr:YcnI family protein [Chloroflexota bacterium]